MFEQQLDNLLELSKMPARKWNEYTYTQMDGASDAKNGQPTKEPPAPLSRRPWTIIAISAVVVLLVVGGVVFVVAPTLHQSKPEVDVLKYVDPLIGTYGLGE